MSGCGRCGNKCVGLMAAPGVKKIVEDTETFISFLNQCRILDAELKQRGFKPVIEQAAKKVLCPCHNVVKNAEIARQLQKHVVEPIFKQLNIKV